MKKKWALAGGIVIGAAAALAYAYSELMFSLASKRKSFIYEREWKRRSPLENDETMKLILKKSDELRGMALERVYVTSHDGLRLAGHWYPAENPERTIILFHGWRSTWSHDFGVISDFLHQNGCNLLYAEQRGHGESEGAYISFGVLERFDVMAWVNFASERDPEKLPLYLSGLSMGASTVLMASALPIADKINGITADCGFTSPVDILKTTLEANTRLPANMTMNVVGRVGKVQAGFNFADYSTVDAMKTNVIPTLFIHGDADDFVPPRMTYENYIACSAPKELLVVHGATHGMSYLVDTRAYQKKVMDFFAKYDKKK